MIFELLKEFDRDSKSLIKKYKSLNDDLEVVRQILTFKPDERPPFSFRINNLAINSCVIKVKKIACKSLKGRGVNSGLRLVYAYFSKEQKIILIEIYHKSEKSTEDRDRIIRNFI